MVQANSSDLARGVAGAGSRATSVMLGTFVALISTFFFLAEGDRIAAWIVELLPRSWRGRAYEAGRRGWVTLGTYAKMQAVVSGFDAIGIGIGAVLLGVPFVLPLIAITFVLCFIPVLGAVVSGALFVLVALAFKGWTTALIMLAVVVAVQQFESSVLGPILMGKAVSLHPLAVLLVVIGGTYLFGFVGALFAVPVAATLNTTAAYLAGRDPFPGLDGGGSALLSSPRQLADGIPKITTPRRLGEATPAWLRASRAQQPHGESEEEAPPESDAPAAADAPAG
ncbi:MAG: AI-2E family transporter [Tetrasphaera sp.]